MYELQNHLLDPAYSTFGEARGLQNALRYYEYIRINERDDRK